MKIHKQILSGAEKSLPFVTVLTIIILLEDECGYQRPS